MSACDLGSESWEDVLSGKFDLVFASAESVTDMKFLQALKKSSRFRDNLTALVVDESHTIDTWAGLSNTSKKNSKAQQETKAFRAAYGNLAMLRSFLKEGTPVAALTGTADEGTMSSIKKSLGMKKPSIVKINPNRENIHFTVVKCKKKDILQKLDWLVDCLKDNGDQTPKTIIYCNTMNDIACVSNYMMMKLGKHAYFPLDHIEPDNCLLGIYHSSSWEHDKLHVTRSLCSTCGKVRVVIASTALSMGVNFPDIRYVINFGPARNLLDQHQEFGRAGRDGLQSYSLIIYHGHQLSHCNSNVKDFVKSTGCLRVAAYSTLDNRVQSSTPLHSCCSFCTLSCKCNGESCSASKPLFDVHVVTAKPKTSTLSRPVSDEDKEDLKGALEEVKEKFAKGASLFDNISGHGFSTELIEDVVKNAHQIFTISDILDTCPIYSVNSAIVILEIIQEIFLDIPNFDIAIELISKCDWNTTPVQHQNEDAELPFEDEFDFPESDDELPEVRL